MVVQLLQPFGVEDHAERIQEAEIPVFFRIILDCLEIGGDVESLVGNLQGQVGEGSQQFPVFFCMLRAFESLENDQQVVLDSSRIVPVGVEKALEWFSAVAGARQVDEAELFQSGPFIVPGFLKIARNAFPEPSVRSTIRTKL